MKIMKNSNQTFASRRFVAVMCALFLTVGLLFSCNEAPKEENKPEFSLCGKDISQYRVVIPEEATVYEEYTAKLLCREIKEVSKKSLKTVTDREKPTECEILIGATSRAESSVKASFKNNEYSVFAKGTKVVLMGSLYAVAGGIPDILSEICGDSTVSDNNNCRTLKSGECSSVILLIGDGMGKNHILLSQTEDIQVLSDEGKAYTPEETGGSVFAAESFPVKGSVTTVNINGEITDSAASATALATGYKTENGVLGMIPADLDGNGEKDELSSVQNVREAACLAGKKTAIISTDRERGATPNAFLVHHSYRYDSDVILEQQKAQSSSFKPTYFNCSYDSEKFTDFIWEALTSCENENGFFIMAEEAMIDKYASRLDFDNVIRTVKRLNDGVALCAVYAACHPEVAVIVTADHETGGLTVTEKGEFMWTSLGEHTDTPVAVYAIGGGTEVLGKDIDNTDIAKFIFSAVSAE